ncbi:tRNA (uracil-5-)-methyltransferase homolog A-like [Mya arenaria]|uniref:tRNA (uracil-5-)-methyltransferase homolog A-like n=1 Tax=Mya arenaria TaxID=6604 RepID=UPI0022DF2979|nr:tRNA (uracil-5-)-methyltransferase homolog A-like [Mya arenaria]
MSQSFEVFVTREDNSDEDMVNSDEKGNNVGAKAEEDGDQKEEKSTADVQEAVQEVCGQDEYMYTKREDFTSELFKLSITNLPRKFGFKEFKKKLSKLDVTPVKLKIWKDVCFVTFRNEEEKGIALEKINGLQWRGNQLIAMVAKPAADPLVQKRKQESMPDRGQGKKPRLTEEDSLSPSERLKNAVTPLWKLEYSEQLKKKEEEMRQFLKRYHRQLEKNCPDLKSWLRESRQKHGAIPCELHNIKPSPETEGYRNKCEFTIGPGEGGERQAVVGFRYGTYAQGTVSVGSPEEVAFLSQHMKDLLKVFQTYLDSSAYGAFHPETHIGHWRQLTVRSSRLGHLMVLLDFHPQQLTQEKLQEVRKSITEFFMEGGGKDSGVSACYFRALLDKTTSSDEPYDFLFGDNSITESLLDMKFQISPNAFFQVNTAGAEVLYQTVSDWCEARSNTTVLDVCCGTGTIGLTLAKTVNKVIGVEMCSEAIADAKKNATLNGVDNVVYHCAKAEDVMKDITKSVFGSEDVVAIVDPPRSGLHTNVVVAIRNCRTINRLVYVSCNVNGALNNLIDLVRPMSKRLTGGRFLPVKAVPVDLFPHTKHCELVILFHREAEDA